MGPESLMERYRLAVLEKNLDAYIALYDEDLLVFDMWQHWDYKGLPAWGGMVKDWFKMLGDDNDVVSFEDVKVQQTGEMALLTAIVRFTAVSKSGEELRYLQNRLTWVLKKKGDEWKIVHQHTSSPVDFESMKVVLQK